VSATSAKLSDPSGRSYRVTLTASGQLADEETLLADERAAANKKYGKLTKELYDALPYLASGQRIWIWIWTTVPAASIPVYDRDTIHSAAARTAALKEQSDILSSLSSPITGLLGSMGDSVAEDGTVSPLVRAKVPVSRIKALLQLPQVAKIGTDEWPGRPQGLTWYNAVHVYSAHQSFSSGNQYHSVCVLEGDQPDDYSRLLVSGIASPGGPTDWHSRYVTGIIHNRDNPVNSVAPNAPIYIANWGGFTGAGGVGQWCRTQQTKVINVSWTFRDGSPGGSDANDWAQDWIAKQPPYALFVNASGNDANTPGHETVSLRSFNTLVVGATNDQGTDTLSDDNMASFSNWRNPVTAHNDFELPNLAAPGVNVTSVGITASGTSAAAPIVAGVAALVPTMDSTFDNWPEMVRATILATATKRLGYGSSLTLPPSSGDQSIGAGVVDAYAALEISDPAFYHTSGWSGRWRTTLGFSSGWDSNNFWTTTFNTGTLNVSGFHLRAVIAWDATAAGCDSYGGKCTGSTLDADLDLVVKDNTTGVSTVSQSWDSSWEIVEIPVASGHNYTIKIRKGATNASSTYLGVAWYVYQL
jgi:hypothetical protein